LNYVLMAGDAQVLTQLRVCIASLALVATDKSNYTVVVAYDGDLTAARWALTGLGVTVHVRALGDVPKCDNVVNGNFFLINHPATLARLQPMRYLPIGVDRALYVDADSLFVADPTPLFSMPLGGWYISVGGEITNLDKSNAGLLFYNLVAWQRDGLEKTICNRMRSMPEPNDETVLKSVAWRRVRFTPMLHHMFGKWSSSTVVVHFWQIKPWQRKWSAFAPAWFALAHDLPKPICWLCLMFGIQLYGRVDGGWR